MDFPSITNVSGGSSQSSSPYREDYTWSASTTDAGAHNVVATNGAGATTNASFTLTQDSAAPTGQSIALTGANAPYYGSASVSFTLGDGNDGSGSGLDTSSRTVTRESASLTGDSCGSFTTDAGTYSSPDTSVSNGNCYRYSFTITDNVGNTSSTVTATAKVDTQAPSVSLTAPTELTGAGNQYYDGAAKTQFFRPAGSGSFRLNATASDSESAVSSVSFPDISGLSGWSGSTGGADTTSPYSSPADYSWSSGAAAPGARNVASSDKAGNSNSDTVTLAADSAAPTGQSLTLTGANAPYYGAASVTFSLGDGNDGSGSGLDLATRSVTRETGDLVAGACSNFSADAGSFSSPDTAVSTGHCYRYTFTIADRVGNVSLTVTATAKVDTDAPVLPPRGRRLVRAERNRKRWPVGRGAGLLPQRRRRRRLGRLDRRRRQLQPLQLTQRIQLELRRNRPRRPLDHRDQRCRDRWNRRDYTQRRLHRPNRANPHPHRHQCAVLQRGFRDVLAR